MRLLSLWVLLQSFDGRTDQARGDPVHHFPRARYQRHGPQAQQRAVKQSQWAGERAFLQTEIGWTTSGVHHLPGNDSRPQEAGLRAEQRCCRVPGAEASHTACQDPHLAAGVRLGPVRRGPWRWASPQMRNFLSPSPKH